MQGLPQTRTVILYEITVNADGIVYIKKKGACYYDDKQETDNRFFRREQE